MTRVLVFAGVWPHVRENTEAANVILHEILLHLTGSHGFEVAFVRVATDTDEPPPAAKDALRALGVLGLTALAGVQSAARASGNPARNIAARYIAASPRWLLPGAGNARDLQARCEEWNADCALTVHCETATAGLFGVPIARMAYYGNPDHKVARAILDFDWEHRARTFDPRLFVNTMKGRLGVKAYERAHLRVMRSYDAVGDVSANDAAFYQRNGVRASYLRNTWPSPVADTWEAGRDRTEQQMPLKIVGNVGNLSATGNTRGLYTLATSVLPALKRTLGDGQFEIHLFGGRRLHRYLPPLLEDPHIRIRGFVPDLDAEILSSPVFLVANNHTEFKVGNTRFLHAWSLGACVVAFRDCADAMPEIVHRKNALLATTPDEMAALIAEAACDTSLRRSLGRAGAATLATEFDPASVTREIAARLLAITGEGGPSDADQR